MVRSQRSSMFDLFDCFDFETCTFHYTLLIHAYTSVACFSLSNQLNRNFLFFFTLLKSRIAVLLRQLFGMHNP